MSSITYPFLRETFLNALEESGSACNESGWNPIHLTLDDGETSCFMPLYLKDHSMGEYVFDHAWANAYHQNGLEYYPKLVTAVPFTPSPGTRLRSNSVMSQQHCHQIIDEVINIAEDINASSWHILFPDDNNLQLFDDPRLLKRTGVQYHWLNKDYQCFDDYLAGMTSRKRKMIKKERDEIKKQNIEVSLLLGPEISGGIWQLFYQLYERTYAKRNGTRGYLTQVFFDTIATTMPEQIAMSVASQNGRPIACALYFFDGHSLYGRYWGSLGEFPFLHFELCYYRGIEFAIKMGLQRYDAGAQGEHKLIRGFEPIKTYSLHWIRHPEFRKAIAQFLDEENLAIDSHITQTSQMLPFKKP